MKLSALQTARYEYAPKLPAMLRNGIADICVSEGAETQSVADQEKIQALLPNTFGKKEITFQKGENTSVAKKQVVPSLPMELCFSFFSSSLCAA